MERRADDASAPGDGWWSIVALALAVGIVVPVVLDRGWALAVGVTALAALAVGRARRATALGTELTRVRNDSAVRTRRLEWEATHDELSGLPNRSGLEAATARWIDRGGDVTAMFIDLDRFKRINDELGHLAGDAVLQVAARRLRASFRPDDLVTRPGGDEFFVLLASTPDGAEMRLLAERAIEALERPIAVGTTTVRISASIGMTKIPAANASLPRLIADCDEALYQAKHQGRGRAVDARRERRAV